MHIGEPVRRRRRSTDPKLPQQSERTSHLCPFLRLNHSQRMLVINRSPVRGVTTTAQRARRQIGPSRASPGPPDLLPCSYVRREAAEGDGVANGELERVRARSLTGKQDTTRISAGQAPKEIRLPRWRAQGCRCRCWCVQVLPVDSDLIHIQNASFDACM